MRALRLPFFFTFPLLFCLHSTSTDLERSGLLWISTKWDHLSQWGAFRGVSFSKFFSTPLSHCLGLSIFISVQNYANALLTVNHLTPTGGRNRKVVSWNATVTSISLFAGRAANFKLDLLLYTFLRSNNKPYKCIEKMYLSAAGTSK